jgi:hypothetical protein
MTVELRILFLSYEHLAQKTGYPIDKPWYPSMK